MKAAVSRCPWDVNGDPDAADRIAGLGVQRVTLAAAYHATRALTPRQPRHPRHRRARRRPLPPGPHWAGRTLRPYAAGDWAPGDAYGTAAAALEAAGLEVHSWVVLTHNARLGAEHPGTSVTNAYGDRYPLAPCIAQPAIRAHLAELAAEAAVRPGARGTEPESCGWYGLAHLHAHDKTAGVDLGDAGQYLMSLCFCTHWRAGYADVGIDAERLAAAVCRGLEPLWRAEAPTDATAEALLGDGELAEAVLGYRAGAARALQEEVVAAVRAAAPRGFQVLLHADPAVQACGANVGVLPAHILSVADGVVVPCTGGPGLLAPFAERRVPGAVIAANLQVVGGMGGSPGTHPADAEGAARQGATELRLYHGGLASRRPRPRTAPAHGNPPGGAGASQRETELSVRRSLVARRWPAAARADQSARRRSSVRWSVTASRLRVRTAPAPPPCTGPSASQAVDAGAGGEGRHR